jgi:hypothetical protein
LANCTIYKYIVIKIIYKVKIANFFGKEREVKQMNGESVQKTENVSEIEKRAIVRQKNREEKEKLEKSRTENIVNFHKGQIIKNYKEFCDLFGEEVKNGGTAKRTQLKDWLRYLEYEKIEGSQGYIIKKVYDKPKLKESTSNGLYVKFIEILLMNELAKRREQECKNDYINLQIKAEDGGDKDSHICLFSKTQLYHLLGMVNDNYLYKNRDIIKENIIEQGVKNSKTGEELKISEWDINHFMDRTSSKLNEILTSALKSMQRRSLIDCRDIMIIVEERIDDETGERKDIYRVANTDEREYVLQVQKRVLNEMGIDSIPFYNSQVFYDKMNKTMYKERRWKRAYKEYEILYLEKYIISDIPIVERELERYIKKNKIELNSRVLETINAQSKTLKITNEKKVEENRDIREDEEIDVIMRKGGLGRIRVREEDLKTKEIKEFNENYLENQEKLAEIFIKLLD